MIGSWYCVPEDELTADALRDYARAGFTHFQTLHGADGSWRPYSREGNLAALALCAEVGLRCFVVDRRIYRGERPYPTRDPVTIDGIAAAVADYRASPALAGYLVYDEPGPEAFPSIAATARELRRLDPGRIPLAPLFPMHDDPRFPDNFGGLTYAEYVEAFLTSCEPTEVAYDYYPYFDPPRRLPRYIENFAIVSAAARTRGIPFWYYAGITRPSGADRPTPGRVRAQVTLALAHGARAVFHYTYRGPPGDTDAPIAPNGRRDDDAWSSIRAVNAEITAFLTATNGCAWLGTVTDGASLPTIEPTGITVEPGAECTVGLFERAGTVLAYVVNRDIDSWRTVRARIGDAVATLDLPPGAARLLVVR